MVAFKKHVLTASQKLTLIAYVNAKNKHPEEAIK